MRNVWSTCESMSVLGDEVNGMAPEEQQIQMGLDGLERQSPERLLDGARILELANKAYFLYLKQPPAEKAKLLRIVLRTAKSMPQVLIPHIESPST